MKSSTTVKGIKSGTYSVYYAYGANWDVSRKKFTDRVGYGVFETDGTRQRVAATVNPSTGFARHWRAN